MCSSALLSNEAAQMKIFITGATGEVRNSWAGFSMVLVKHADHHLVPAFRQSVKAPDVRFGSLAKILRLNRRCPLYSQKRT
jgi:hypothetical protein